MTKYCRNKLFRDLKLLFLTVYNSLSAAVIYDSFKKHYLLLMLGSREANDNEPDRALHIHDEDCFFSFTSRFYWIISRSKWKPLGRMLPAFHAREISIKVYSKTRLFSTRCARLNIESLRHCGGGKKKSLLDFHTDFICDWGEDDCDVSKIFHLLFMSYELKRTCCKELLSERWNWLKILWEIYGGSWLQITQFVFDRKCYDSPRFHAFESVRNIRLKFGSFVSQWNEPTLASFW